MKKSESQRCTGNTSEFLTNLSRNTDNHEDNMMYTPTGISDLKSYSSFMTGIWYFLKCDNNPKKNYITLLVYDICCGVEINISILSI